MAEKGDQEFGLIITDDEGRHYYLRPEVLERTRMADEDVKKLRAGLDEIAPSALRAVGGVMKCPRIDKSVIDDDLAAGTVMCPW